MGWLSKLITIGSAVAAPFTGGTSLLANLGQGLVRAAPALAGLGEVAGGASTGAMEERVRQMNYGLTKGQLALDRTGLEQTEQQRSARNEVLAQLFGNLQDVRLQGRPSRMPEVSIAGGLRPSALGNREAIQELLRQRVEMPDIDKYIHAGGLETALGVGGAIASGIGAFAPKPTSAYTSIRDRHTPLPEGTYGGEGTYQGPINYANVLPTLAQPLDLSKLGPPTLLRQNMPGRRVG